MGVGTLYGFVKMAFQWLRAVSGVIVVVLDHGLGCTNAHTFFG